MKNIPIFNLSVPIALPGIDSEILDPRDSYVDPLQWSSNAEQLALRFIKNFESSTDNEEGKALVVAGPQLELK